MEEHRKIHAEYIAGHSGATRMYTDGSKTADQVAYAIVTVSAAVDSLSGLQRVLHPHASAYEAELMAIMEATKIALSKAGRILIFTDSQAALKAINGPKPTEPVARQIQQWIKSTHGRVSIDWVPGHIGIRGNELADELAKKPAPPLDEQIIPPMISFLSREASALWRQRRQNEWNNTTTFLRSHWGDIQEPKYDSGLSRRDQTVLLRCRLGHTKLTHQHLFSRTPLPGCVDCQRPLTIQHILVDCRITRDYFGGTIPPLSVLLSPADPSPLFSLLQHLNLTPLI